MFRKHFKLSIMEALKKNHKRIISLKQAKKIIFVLIFILFFEFFLFPAPIFAAEVNNIGVGQGRIAGAESDINMEALLIEEEFKARLPENPDQSIDWAKNVVITAYNSEAGQTDNSPCITANSFNVCDHGVEDTVAANFLKFGAKIKIPALFGDKVFVVRDRMNKRFSNRVDVWMLEKPQALKFGVKVARIEVLK